ncbi:hypothetical protein CAPTEDRAFT_204988 [Capitella teleta]|uniref:Uncharacterized protein n=1 Tax=Capitella teleta TaxID=283909 RepID=R7UIH8_CAPTE|nr:hypothetical protein CAPTEDRAFT_204988 [Capitella teleta]|eukprot:ELU06369.1 hypothetical protein CAPTEDRAFT_204988 [Capitella teleta]
MANSQIIRIRRQQEKKTSLPQEEYDKWLNGPDYDLMCARKMAILKEIYSGNCSKEASVALSQLIHKELIRISQDLLGGEREGAMKLYKTLYTPYSMCAGLFNKFILLPTITMNEGDSVLVLEQITFTNQRCSMGIAQNRPQANQWCRVACVGSKTICPQTDSDVKTCEGAATPVCVGCPFSKESKVKGQDKQQQQQVILIAIITFVKLTPDEVNGLFDYKESLLQPSADASAAQNASNVIINKIPSGYPEMANCSEH